MYAFWTYFWVLLVVRRSLPSVRPIPRHRPPRSGGGKKISAIGPFRFLASRALPPPPRAADPLPRAATPPFRAIYSCADGLVLAGRSNGRAAPASPSPRRPRPLRILHRASFIHAGGAAVAGFIASDRSSIVPSHLSLGKLVCFNRSIVVPMWAE